MWKCGSCGSEMGEGLLLCTDCGKAKSTDLAPEPDEPPPPLICLRCRQPLEEREETEIPGVGPVDVFVCPECGHLEFFSPRPPRSI